MTETRTRYTSRYRDVSDLRTQFQCEYRLHLNQKHGSHFSPAAQEGIGFHERVKLHAEGAGKGDVRFLAVVILVTILAAIMWVLG